MPGSQCRRLKGLLVALLLLDWSIRVAGDWVLEGADTCPLVKLPARLYAVNAACCNQNGQEECNENGHDGATPRACSMDCAATFVPFYGDCGGVMQSLLDNSDGEEDNSVKTISGFYERCIGGNIGQSARDTIVAMGGCNASRPICAEPREHKPPRCPIFTHGITKELNRTALLEPYVAPPPPPPSQSTGFGRRQAQSFMGGVGGTAACSMNNFESRMAELSTACCDDSDEDDICQEGVPYSCDFECAVVWNEFREECQNMINRWFDRDHHTLRHFQVLTDTCNEIPVMPMLHAIQTALNSCECRTNELTERTTELACSPVRSPYWWLKVVPQALPAQPSSWLHIDEEASCPVAHFESRLAEVNSAC
eukprot:SAG31_NODE_10389_length_1144_cov_2.727273_2_plen_366_part_01